MSPLVVPLYKKQLYYPRFTDKLTEVQRYQTREPGLVPRLAPNWGKIWNPRIPIFLSSGVISLVMSKRSPEEGSVPVYSAK